MTQSSSERFKNLEGDLEKAIEGQEEAVEALQQFKQEPRQRIAIWELLVVGKGSRVSDKFVRHARTLLHLNAGLFLSAEEYDAFMADVPSLRWFQLHREGLGLESYLPLHVDAHCQMRTHPTMGI